MEKKTKEELDIDQKYDNNMDMCKDLDIHQVYDNYIDLYIHLDKLRWNAVFGIAALFYSVFSVLNGMSLNSTYFLLTNGVGFIIMGFILYRYSDFINKFVVGQDFISELLSSIEEKNKYIFSEDISSPKEGEKYKSFFIRRSRSIERKYKQSDKSEPKIKLEQKCKPENASPKKMYRASEIMNTLLSNSYKLFFITGILLIILNLFCLIFQKDIDNFILLHSITH